MTSSRSDNFIYIGLNAGDPTPIPLMWTQVGSIVFPVYSTILILYGPISVGNENVAVTTSRNDASSMPHSVHYGKTDIDYDNV